MADKPLPQFTDVDYKAAAEQRQRLIAQQPRRTTQTTAPVRPLERRRGLLATIDSPILVVVVLLLAIGSMMVYSTTFDWAFQSFGSESYILIQHLRNILLGAVVFAFFMLVNYRFWKRVAWLLLVITIGSLIGVLFFSDEVFGARRSLLNGSYQPGELAELTIIMYMAAWLGSKKTKVASFFSGLVPFTILIVLIGGLVMLQPDISTAATIFIVAGLMYFLAGANMMHVVGVLGVLGSVGWVLSQRLIYAQDRVTSYLAGLADLTQTNYHAQQAIIAFLNGGWTGVGLGQGRQKFGFLPAPHTDSIFAVIGEELGVIGAMFVVMLYIILVIRGLRVARKAPDTFGALLASGITLWIVTKAMMNIAVMINLLPSTGVALPFISYGGSSLLVVMAGAGLLLSVSRVTTLQQSPEGRGNRADYDRGWGNRWSRLSGFSRGRDGAGAAPRR